MFSFSQEINKNHLKVVSSNSCRKFTTNFDSKYQFKTNVKNFLKFFKKGVDKKI